MKIEEVFPALREGKAIRRKDEDWQEEYGFLYIISPLPPAHSYNMVLQTETQYRYSFIDNIDWRADDWEVIDLEHKDLDADLQDFEIND